jgi:putative glutamine amidotransferase
VRPLIGIPSDLQIVNEQERYTSETPPAKAIARVVGAIPLIIPALGGTLDAESLLDSIHGLMVPGGLTNVDPTLYGQAATADKGPFDRHRDATSLPLIRGALRRGLPLLMTCRGFQELNVALGGTLKRERDQLPEAQKHGTPASATAEDERFRIRHELNVVPGGTLAAILGTETVQVNSLHSQLIDRLASDLVVEATAADGSIEAATVRGARGFALGVIFHPEYWAERDGPSLAILNAFGTAVRRYADRKQPLEVAHA